MITTEPKPFHWDVHAYWSSCGWVPYTWVECSYKLECERHLWLRLQEIAKTSSALYWCAEDEEGNVMDITREDIKAHRIKDLKYFA